MSRREQNEGGWRGGGLCSITGLSEPQTQSKLHGPSLRRPQHHCLNMKSPAGSSPRPGSLFPDHIPYHSPHRQPLHSSHIASYLVFHSPHPTLPASTCCSLLLDVFPSLSPWLVPKLRSLLKSLPLHSEQLSPTHSLLPVLFTSITMSLPTGIACSASMKPGA